MNALNRRQSNLNLNQRRELRSWFRSRRRRHDLWLVFNMFAFTFEGQPLHRMDLLASQENMALRRQLTAKGDKKCEKIRNLCKAISGHR